MPLDPSIGLSFQQPKFPTAQDTVSLANMVSQMQTRKQEQMINMQQLAKAQQIQALASAPGSTDEKGYFTPEFIKATTAIDAETGLKFAGMSERQKLADLQLADVKSKTDANKIALAEHAEKFGDKVLSAAVGRVDVEAPNVSPERKDELINKYIREETDREKNSGIWSNVFGDQHWDAISRQRYTYGQAKSKIETPKEIRAEERAEETPFMKELRSRGVKPGSDEWNREIKKHQQKQEGLTINLGPAMTPGGIESAAAQAATGQPLSQVVPGYGNAAAAKREQVRQAAIQQIMKEKPGMTPAEAGLELANRSTDYVAGRRSVTQLNLMLGATKQAVSQLEFNINKTKEVLRKIPSSDLSPVINAIIRQEEKWTGDPKYSELFYFMSATAQESARILQGGQASVAQLHMGAADEARKWANVNMTPKMFIEGVAPAMIEEGRYRLKSYEDAKKSQRSGGGETGPMPVTETTPYSNLRKDKPPVRDMKYDDPDKEKRYQEWKRQNAQ